jgi:hypothetical protein
LADFEEVKNTSEKVNQETVEDKSKEKVEPKTLHWDDKMSKSGR